MNKITIATIAVIACLALGAYLVLHHPFNPDRAEIEELSEAFMEDLQYKDFGSAARYHHELEQDRVDIGREIESLFKLDPELLDIMDYRITRSEIDSTGDRGRVLVNTRFRPLKPEAISEDDDDIQEADLQLYWMRRHPECPLGTDCNAEGVCVDDTGTEATHETGSDDADDEDKREVAFECDATAEHQWFMNLDSTLESRDYQ